jgi:hypothetical protein
VRREGRGLGRALDWIHRISEGIREFAARRGLDYVGPRELRALTPALLTGSGGGDDVAEGELADGFDGTLTHHVFSERRHKRDSTVVVGAVPEIVPFVRALVCRDRSSMEDADLAQLPAERWQRSEFESVEFNRRYQLFTLVGQDTTFMYELFSPALISWLCSRVPAGFGFELNDGNLAVLLPGHIEDPAGLEELCSLAASLAERIRREAMEEQPDSQLYREDEVRRDLDRGVSTVTWERPPESVNEAVYAYREVAARRPWVLGVAALWGLLAAAGVAALAALVAGPIAVAGAGLVAFGVAFYLARLIASIRYRFGSVRMQRVALEAFIREYARARGLELRDRWAFHSEMRGFPLPGIADHVLAGRLPGTDIDGRFVMFGAAPEMRSLGEEMAFTTDRPLAASGLLARLAVDPGDDATGAELPEHYRLEARGRDVLVWRPIQGNLIRTAEGSDNFCRKAGEVVRGLGPRPGPDVRPPR